MEKSKDFSYDLNSIPESVLDELDRQQDKNPRFDVHNFFKQHGINPIENVVNVVAETSDDNNQIGKSKNLLKALKWYSHASKLDGLMYGVESGHPNAPANLSESELDKIAERSKRLKVMGKGAIAGSLGLSLLNQMGYPSEIESPEELDELSGRFIEDFTGPKNAKKRASIRRKLNNNLKESK